MKRFILAGISITALAVTGMLSMANANAQAADAPQQIQAEQLQACSGDKSRGTTSQDGQSRTVDRA
jgi:hypothetical protein